VSVWFSHPAVFWVVSAAVVFLLAARGDKTRFFRLAFVFSTWAASCVALYVVSLRHLETDSALLNFWAQYFPPRPIGSIHSLLWLFDVFSISFRDPTGLAIIPGMGFFLIGCAGLFRRDRTLGWIVSGSCLTMVLAASVHRYPLVGRLLIFAVPVILLLVAEGVSAVSVRLPSPMLVRVALGCLVLFQPALDSIHKITGPQPDDIRPVLEYVEANARPSDVCYVYFQAQPQMLYYSKTLRLRLNWRLGSDCGSDAACYAKDVDSLAGKSRAWIVFSHVLVRGKADDRAVLVEQLDKKGRRMEEFSSRTAQAYLYDLSSP
jgi:hypothetical protein